MKPLVLFLFSILVMFFVIAGCKRSNPPAAMSVVSLQKPKVSVNVILETSASMQGYLNGSQFKSDVTNFIAELDKMSKDTTGLVIDSVKYFASVIKNNIPRFEPISCTAYDFNTKILTGKIATGSTSPIDDIVNKLVDEHSQNKISILISDFVVNIKSPSIIPAIQSRFNTIFNNAPKKNLAVSLYRLTSDFSGIYYPSFGKSFKAPNKVTRPYFIWVLGDKNNLISFRRQIERSPVFKPLQEAQLGFGSSKIPFDILYYSNSPEGRFRFKNGEFTNVSLKNNNLKITLGVDLNSIPKYAREISYLQQNKDASSASCNINYCNIYPHSVLGSRFHPKDKAHSHYIEVSVSQFRLDKNIVHLGLKNKPIDLDSLSTNDDSNLNQGNNLKTFLLKEIITGMQNAYGELNSDSNYFNFDLIINKN